MENRVFKLLYREKKPLSVYMISKKLHVAVSSARYVVKKMVDRGVVVEFREKNRLYGLHPMFFDKKFWDDIVQHLRCVMETVVLHQKKEEYVEWSNCVDVAYVLKIFVDVLSKK